PRSAAGCTLHGVCRSRARSAAKTCVPAGMRAAAGRWSWPAMPRSVGACRPAATCAAPRGCVRAKASNAQATCTPATASRREAACGGAASCLQTGGSSHGATCWPQARSARAKACTPKGTSRLARVMAFMRGCRCPRMRGRRAPGCKPRVGPRGCTVAGGPGPRPGWCLPRRMAVRIDVERDPQRMQAELDILYERFFAPMGRPGLTAVDWNAPPHLRCYRRTADGEHYVYVEDALRGRLAGCVVFNRLPRLDRRLDAHVRSPHSRFRQIG